MGVFQSTLLYLILLQSCRIIAYKDQEWKKATATYAKDSEGSLVTGTTSLSPWFFLRSLRMKTTSCFWQCGCTMCCRRSLWLWRSPQGKLWQTQCWLKHHVVQQREHMWGMLWDQMCRSHLVVCDGKPFCSCYSYRFLCSKLWAFSWLWWLVQFSKRTFWDVKDCICWNRQE